MPRKPRTVAANSKGFGDILKSPDLNAEIQETLKPLAPLGFNIQMWTSKELAKNMLSPSLFLRTIKILFSNPDTTYFSKLMALGVAEGKWVQNQNCTCRDLFDFCQWLKTKDGDAKRANLSFELKMQKRALPAIGSTKTALVGLFGQCWNDMTADMKVVRLAREEKIEKYRRKLARQRRKLANELEDVRVEYAPVSRFQEPSEQQMEEACYKMYKQDMADQGLKPLRWSETVVQKCKQDYGAEVRARLVAEYVGQEPVAAQIEQYTRDKVLLLGRRGNDRQATNLKKLLACATGKMVDEIAPDNKIPDVVVDSSGSSSSKRTKSRDFDSSTVGEADYPYETPVRRRRRRRSNKQKSGDKSFGRYKPRVQSEVIRVEDNERDADEQHPDGAQ